MKKEENIEYLEKRCQEIGYVSKTSVINGEWIPGFAGVLVELERKKLESWALSRPTLGVRIIIGFPKKCPGRDNQAKVSIGVFRKDSDTTVFIRNLRGASSSEFGNESKSSSAQKVHKKSNILMLRWLCARQICHHLYQSY